ncbi:glycogen/starch/alpha-glucan phosphorylase [Sedimenticola sp.]|uniref:glycogen/starch/alpha-glucan phosphorylase n=1 Tax=Sedimenticola sp. TaxID=1940285 RepID=UPI003D11E9C2
MTAETNKCSDELFELTRLPSDSSAIAIDFQRYLTRHLGRFIGCIPLYQYEALSLVIRDRIMMDWRDTWRRYDEPGVRKAYYLSLEFLIGRSLGNHLLNLGLDHSTEEAMNRFALNLEEIVSEEVDAGLGNGGLGRLAACFMDSCACMQLPVIGYGIRYQYGMFRQRIENGFQVEEPDHWLRDGYPWELERPEYKCVIRFGGRISSIEEGYGKSRPVWVDTSDVLAIPYDVPISGYRNHTINTLRLWSASATSDFDLDDFNAGSYSEAVEAKNNAEHITMVLYPNDVSENGRELRLKQQYFLASASLQDVLRMWENTEGPDYSQFKSRNVFHLNDTHPTIAVAELMRLLIDEKGLAWEEAWDITSHCMAYTNHTLLPEALEKWTVGLFEKLLPRLLQIIYEINAHFLKQVAMRWPGQVDRQSRMSIIEEGDVKQIRMAYLAIVGSFSINGVAALHSRLLTSGLFRDFYELWPEKFNNKTNGVTPRRWVAYANPGLRALITDKIGDDWVQDYSKIAAIREYVEDTEFIQRWYEVKQANKQRLSEMVENTCGVKFDTTALFDVQVKRIHEYKRQLLNVLHVIHLYDRIKRGDSADWTKRCILIGGKAAPGYKLAKKIVKLINNVAEVINSDPQVNENIKLAFIPNYGVSKMEVICPGTDLSEQISTAGKEASGTGNMKFMMNGAITIGTYDGANIEIMDALGSGNYFLFGLHAEEVEAARAHYNPGLLVEEDEDLQRAMHLLQCGHFNTFEPAIFDDVIQALLNPNDPWLTLADFRSYVEAQERVSRAYLDRTHWVQMSIMNTACSGPFSTDRTISEYNAGIWNLQAKPVIERS